MLHSFIIFNVDTSLVDILNLDRSPVNDHVINHMTTILLSSKDPARVRL